MKDISLLIIAFLFLQFTTLAQQGWFQQTSGTNSPLHSVHFVNENYGWISGENGIIKNTTNGGQSWNNTAFHGSQTSKWYCIWFVNVNDGYAAGSTYIVDRWISNWALTTNGGASWEWQTSWGNDYSSTRSLFFLNEDIGWKVGPRNGEGYIYKTTTGITGFVFLLSTPDPLYSVWFVDSDNGWCVGNDGAIYTSSDGGENWTSQTSGTSKDLKSVCFVNFQNGWATGYADNQAVILNTDNGGQSWNSYLPSSIKELNSIFFIDANLGWTCGRMMASPNDKGVILYTSDGGLNWEPQHIDNNCSEFYSVNFLNPTTGWAVGSSGTIIKTTTGGITSIDEVIDEIPTEFVLEQNYPNPFNPSTKIKFTIPTVERFAESLNNAERIGNSLYNITLKVYDVLGNEVTTLADEDKPAGTYEVEFNPANHQLSSGIYFYQLKAVPTGRQAGNFNQAKKMLFIK